MTPLQFKLTRVALGYSQSTFADRLGVSRQTVSNWETGRFALPDDINEMISAVMATATSSA